jgi:hypothetical protein
MFFRFLKLALLNLILPSHTNASFTYVFPWTGFYPVSGIDVYQDSMQYGTLIFHCVELPVIAF